MTTGTSQATAPQIYTLLAKVMADVGAVGKTRRNPQQGYSFRGIDDILNAVHGPMAKHGVVVVPEVLEREVEERETTKGVALLYTRLRVKHTFYAPDGSSVSAVTDGEGMDTSDKSCNKAMSASLKYALIEVFAIATGEQVDSEYDSPEPASRRMSRTAQRGGHVQKQSPADTARREAWLKMKDTLEELGYTKDDMGRAIYLLFGNKPWKELTAEEIQELNEYIREGYNPDLEIEHDSEAPHPAS